MNEKLLTVQDVAERLQVAERTVREWLRDGRIRGRNLGGRAGWRVHPADLDAFIQGLEDNQRGKIAA